MDNGHRNDQTLEAPPKLVAALKQLTSESIFVPPIIDEALMKAARRRLSRAERMNFNWFRLIPWGVATAGLAAAVLLAYPYAKDFFGSAGSSNSTRAWKSSGNAAMPEGQSLPNLSEDLNHDGKVDILDAFLLARKIQGSYTSDPHLDFNGDGLVDRRDVEAIAAHAVSVAKGGRS